MKPNYARKIYTLDDDDLERLIDDWVGHKQSKYHSSEIFAGAGDMGRDVVGYQTASRLEGDWDNFQCKQLKRSLTRPGMLRELAKIFYHSGQGHFSLPANYTFVAPRGITRPANDLLTHPTELAAALKEDWDTVCSNHISDGVVVKLDPALEFTIDSFDFTHVDSLDANRLASDASMKPVLVDWFGADPGAPPPGSTPEKIQPEEAQYLEQLVAAYGQRRGMPYADATAALECSAYGRRLKDQRTRFFEAARFQRYYRDNTPEDVLRSFEDDVYHSVIETFNAAHADALAKVDAVMERAALVSVTGVLNKYARVPVRQGTCHHFANDGVLSWK
ncbi:hypothetical protein FSZ31_00975 [Sphingorhabdus soli]|uniref:ABC-three component systems C-terminal domain-containing protein n=1 Tax=Flavisphingopyxis soli TaxID=2601267 RepID=A0A5C6UKH3_9SPHN|nr:ABC-three component system protein [Sphingorhabdus soli]TXC73367.1 hypothetical protein FSZ31_00975 [Sphingorhabdus soli]